MERNVILNAVPPNERFKKLLYQFWAKKQLGNEDALKELDQECAYWLIVCEDLSPLLVPTRPYKMREYDFMTTKEKRETPASFWRQHDIEKYLEQKTMVKYRNKGMLDTLREFKSCIPEADTLTHQKYQSIIYEYET